MVRRPLVLTPPSPRALGALAVLRIANVSVQLVRIILERRRAERARRIPYHTSALTGAMWVNELLTGHPGRFRTELGVHRSTFILLVKAMQKLGLQSSRHVSIEEQVAIFLYTAVTGITCVHTGERFQHSTSTITK